MKSLYYSRAFGAAFFGVSMLGTTPAALANIKDYEFRLVDQAVQAGPDKIEHWDRLECSGSRSR